MKLFQQMLVATAALGLVAPIAAQASDVLNLDGMNDYSRSKKSAKRIDSKTFVTEVNEEIANLKGRIDGLEAQQNNFEAGSFSDTTTLDGKAVFYMGAVDGATKVDSTDTESLQTGYTYTMNLNTSFTGDDNLYVRLRTGASGSIWGAKTTSYHLDRYSGTTDALAVDKIWYTFPLGIEGWTATVAPKIENYYMLAATPSIYKPGVLKAFKLGGHSAVNGASTDGGAGVKYVNDNGFAFASNFVSKGSKTTAGIFTKEAKGKWDTQVAYTKPSYHVSLTYSDQQNGWNSYSYYATSDAATKAATADSTAYMLRAYWRPENAGTSVPEISVGYDVLDITGNGDNVKEADSYFVGLGWDDMFTADDKVGLAFGQPLKATKYGASGSTDVDPFLWEAYYSYKVNDSVTVQPAIFGGSDVRSDTEDDMFGVALTSYFKF